MPVKGRKESPPAVPWKRKKESQIPDRKKRWLISLDKKGEGGERSPRVDRKIFMLKGGARIAEGKTGRGPGNKKRGEERLRGRAE